MAWAGGRWWVLISSYQNPRVIAFDSDWNRTNTTHEFAHQPVSVYGSEERLYTVTEDWINREFTIDSGVSGTQIWRGEEFDNLNDAADFYRGEDGSWWVLTRGGKLYELDSSWALTGNAKHSLTADPNCGFGLGILTIFIGLGFLALPVILGFVTYTTYISVRDRAKSDRDGQQGSIGDTANNEKTSEAISHDQSLVRWYRLFGLFAVIAGFSFYYLSLRIIDAIGLFGWLFVAMAPVATVIGEVVFLWKEGLEVTGTRVLELVGLNLPLFGHVIISWIF